MAASEYRINSLTKIPAKRDKKKNSEISYRKLIFINYFPGAGWGGWGWDGTDLRRNGGAGDSARYQSQTGLAFESIRT